MNFGVVCVPNEVYSSAINNVSGPNFSQSSTSHCSCNVPSSENIRTVNFANPTGYNIGGTNVFNITNLTTSTGFFPASSLNNNYAKITVTYGSGSSLDFAWSPGGETTESITVSPTDTTTYTVVGLDSTGCSSESYITINVIPPPITFSLAGTDTTCPGGNDGSITVSNIGASSAVQYSIDNGTFGSSNIFSNLSVGSYSVQLQDGSYLSEIQTITIEQTADITPPSISTQDTTVQLGVNGQGAINLSDILTSATDNCGVASSVASQLTFDCTNVGDNAVTITVTDVNGQITSQVVTVTVLDVLLIETNDDSFELASCEPITFSTADLLGNDVDPYGTNLKVDFVAQPSSGSIVDNGNGTFTYTAGSNVNHTATASYLVKRDDGTTVFSGNGHFYEFISAPGINWADAKAAAEARSYNGQSGYLVTITSAEENQFAFSKISAQGWIGASDAAVEGEWRWVGGPENGQLFWSGLANGGPVNGAYNAWGGGEPNNAGNEDYAHFRTDGLWNDYPLSVGGGIQGYVVEYGGNSNDCNIESTSTATISFLLNDVVLPSVQTQNISVYLDMNGATTITPEMIDNGSNDACGIASISLDNTSFDCSNVGNNTVTLTVADVNGNSASQMATVTVIDNQVPTVLTQGVTVQLDANGVASITTTDINNGSFDNCSISNITLDTTTFDCSTIGNNTVTLTVVDINGNSASQTATVTVQDNIAPTVITKNIVVELNANGVASIIPSDIDNGSFDNCSITNTSLDITSFDCTNVGDNTVILTVIDVNGNSASQTAIVTVQDNIAPTVITKNITIDLDVNGVASIVPSNVDNGTFDNCAFTLSLSQTSFSCGNVGDNIVSLTAIDAHGLSTTAQATVTVRDVIAPIAIAQDITIQLDVNGVATIVPTDIDNGSNDACGVSLALDTTTFDCLNVGENTVTLTVTDTNLNVSTVTALVTVEDNIAPVAIAQDITIQLDVNGAASIVPSDVDNGSNDACGVSLALDTTTFDCSNVGENTVTLTVTDTNLNVSTVTAVVTVEDNIAPVTITQDITIQLDVNGAASIVPSDIDNGSNDACPITFALDITTFDCSNVGVNPVVLTVTDASGNFSSQTANVTVQDTIAAEVITQDIHVYLDENGATSIVPSDIDNGSNDACGIESIVLDITNFDCSNLGENTVILTVTDVNGNVSSKEAIVTVIDAIAPIVGTQNISVTLDANGNATITPEDLLILDEDDVLRGDACQVSDAEHHAMYLSNYKKASWGWGWWKNGDKAPKSSKTNTANTAQKHWYENAEFVFDKDGGTIIKNLDGTATVTGTLVNKQDPNDLWTVTLELSNARNWEDWSALGRSYKGNWWSVRDSYRDWMYYEMAAGSKLTGAGSNVGKETSITHAPGNLTYGFQLGEKANLMNGNLGLSGAFYYTNQDGQTQQGDFNLDVTNCGILPVPEGTLITSDNCSLVDYDVDINSFGCDNLGDNIVNVTVTDQSGNATTVPVTVTVLGETPSISIDDFYSVYGQKQNTVFLGYAESVYLKTQVSGGTGFSYEWTNEVGDVISTEAFPKVSPEITSTYTVIVTNSNGCQATASIEVCVIDARDKDKWGRYTGKVTICHHSHHHSHSCGHGYHKSGSNNNDNHEDHHDSNSYHENKDKLISVSKHAVQAHLWHGDVLGGCEATCITGEEIDDVVEIVPTISAYPNPSSGVFKVKLENFEHSATVSLYNIYGWVIEHKRVNCNSNEVEVTLGNSRLKNGAYIIKVISNNTVYTKTMIVERGRH